jgi:hypothetical protein
MRRKTKSEVEEEEAVAPSSPENKRFSSASFYTTFGRSGKNSADAVHDGARATASLDLAYSTEGDDAAIKTQVEPARKSFDARKFFSFKSVSSSPSPETNRFSLKMPIIKRFSKPAAQPEEVVAVSTDIAPAAEGESVQSKSSDAADKSKNRFSLPPAFNIAMAKFFTHNVDVAEETVKEIEAATSSEAILQVPVVSASESLVTPATEAILETATEAIPETATKAIPETATKAIPETATEAAPVDPATDAIPETATEAAPVDPATDAIPETATKAIPETAVEVIKESEVVGKETEKVPKESEAVPQVIAEEVANVLVVEAILETEKVAKKRFSFLPNFTLPVLEKKEAAIKPSESASGVEKAVPAASAKKRFTFNPFKTTFKKDAPVVDAQPDVQESPSADASQVETLETTEVIANVPIAVSEEVISSTEESIFTIKELPGIPQEVVEVTELPGIPQEVVEVSQTH